MIVEHVLNYPTMIPLLAYLSIVSYYDVKYREASDTVLFSGYPAIVAGLIYAVLSGRVPLEELLIHGILATWVVGGTAVMARKGLVGSGDLVIMGAVALGVPYVVWVSIFPLPVFALVILGGAIYVLGESMANAVHNARRWSMFLKATAKCGRFTRVYYLFYGRVFTVAEFKTKKFYFPLVDEEGSRLVARAGVEPLDSSEHDVKGELVVATKGMPMAVELLVGTTLAYVFLVF